MRIPVDLMERVFEEYKEFSAKKFVVGLNKIIEEIGEQIVEAYEVSFKKKQIKVTTVY